MSNGMTPVFVPGQWNAVCDRCGRDFKSGDLRRTWQGWMCCEWCWEPRQPQDFVKGVPDNMSAPWTRPVTGLPTNLIGNPIGPGTFPPTPTPPGQPPAPAPAPGGGGGGGGLSPFNAIASDAIAGDAIVNNT